MNSDASVVLIYVVISPKDIPSDIMDTAFLCLEHNLNVAIQLTDFSDSYKTTFHQLEIHRFLSR